MALKSINVRLTQLQTEQLAALRALGYNPSELIRQAIDSVISERLAQAQTTHTNTGN
jgi:Arc/MetJ-type ribon-helix-helix transcriptional regulator